MMIDFIRLSLSMTFTDCCAQNFFFTGESVFPFPKLSQVCNSKPLFSLFVNIFMTKTCFSVHITNSSINFTWFAFLSQQKINDRPLFKPGELY